MSVRMVVSISEHVRAIVCQDNHDNLNNPPLRWSIPRADCTSDPAGDHSRTSRRTPDITRECPRSRAA